MQSPLKLFRSLQHGDPQAVAVTAVCVFFLSVCWFSWTLLAPQKTEALPLGSGRKTKAAPAGSAPSLREVLEAQRSYVTPGDVPNPFFREAPAPASPRERPPRNPDNAKQPDAVSPAPKTPPPPPPPSTRPLTLTYRGLLKRPDQTTVALLEVAEDNSRRFIQPGESLDGFTLNSISPEGIELQQTDGPVLFLPRGETRRFEVPL